MDLLTLFGLSLISILVGFYSLASVLAHKTFKRLNGIFELDPILKTYQEAKPVIHIPKNCKVFISHHRFC